MNEHATSLHRQTPCASLEFLRNSVGKTTEINSLYSSVFSAMLKKSHGLFLDMDGSSIMVEPVHAAIGVQVLHEIGFYEATIAWWFKYLGKGHDATWELAEAEMIARGAHLAMPKAEFKAECLGRYLPYLQNLTPEQRTALIRPGLRMLIDEAKAQGKPVAVVSGNEEHVVQANIDAIGIRDAVDLVISHTTITSPILNLRGKPSPDSYRYAARKLRVNPLHGLALEDSKTGFKSAHDAGMKVVGIYYPEAGQQPYTQTPYNVANEQHLGEALTKHITNHDIGKKLRELLDSDKAKSSSVFESMLDELERAERAQRIRVVSKSSRAKDAMAEAASAVTTTLGFKRNGHIPITQSIALKPSS